RIVEPPALISTVTAPEIEAVVSEARAATSVTACGRRKQSFAVPAVRAVVSSPTATISDQGTASLAAWWTRCGVQEYSAVLAPFSAWFCVGTAGLASAPLA